MCIISNLNEFNLIKNRTICISAVKAKHQVSIQICHMTLRSVHILPGHKCSLVNFLAYLYEYSRFLRYLMQPEEAVIRLHMYKPSHLGFPFTGHQRCAGWSEPMWGVHVQRCDIVYFQTWPVWLRGIYTCGIFSNIFL